MIVKICGTTSEDDALLSVALGADLVGFVFAPSPRQIAPQIAADIVKRMPPEIVAVGVFRDEAPKRVVDIALRSGMRAVQLHGHESAEDTRWVRQRVPMVIKAFSAGDPRLARAVDYGADVVLLDGPRPGSGQGWDRSLVDEVPAGLRVMVAGGVTPGNVAEVIARTHCWGVDVSTGVEKAPGVKDPVKLRELIAAAKAADPDGPDGGPYDWEEDG